MSAPLPKNLFLSTGIAELNDLLTRTPSHGLSWPDSESLPSSATVIRGNAGTGKTVLCSLLARNIHLQIIEARSDPNKTRVFIVPFCIYFSFSQPARGMYHYMQDILNGNLPAESIKDRGPPPLLISPRSADRISSSSGVEVLRRGLLRELTPLAHPAYLPLDSNKEWEKKTRNFIHHFRDSDQWEIGIPDEECDPAGHIRKIRSEIQNLTSESSQEYRIQIEPVVIVDPINFLFDHADSRTAISELINVFRVLKWPLIATIEDGGDNSDEVHRQLVSFVEFEADVVMQLGTTPRPYVSRTIEVKKNRNSQPRLGTQFYRIERPGHAFWNIPWSWSSVPIDTINKDRAAMLLRHDHPGFMLFPSIHWFLSKVRQRHPVETKHRRSSGIREIDKLLHDPNALPGEDELNTEIGLGDVSNLALPFDSFILVRGGKGGHKLTTGFNMLVAGLWSYRSPMKPPDSETEAKGMPKADFPASATVMLLSMGEEIHNGIPRIALSEKNRQGLTHKIHKEAINLPHPNLAENSSRRNNKVEIRLWVLENRAEEINEDPKTKTEKHAELIRPETPKIVEVKFKPGLLTPDEFLWVVSSLTDLYQPSRLMLENTAHLNTRFPQLSAEKMLFQALGSLAQDRNMTLIVTDITDPGSDPKLSLGLAASADYIFDISEFSDEERDELEKLKRPDDYGGPWVGDSNEAELVWSKLLLSNIRGKKYVRNSHAITVAPGSESGHNELHMHDVKAAVAKARTNPHGQHVASTDNSSQRSEPVDPDQTPPLQP